MSAELADDELLITRTFDAPASIVFALWSEPEHMKRWMGPKDFTCPVAEIDFRVGGAYRGMIKSAAYGESWFGGAYREIERYRRLVFTFAWDEGPSASVETLITITFEEHDGKTVQTFHQAPFLNAERRDSHIGGWNSAFDKLSAYAAQQAKETRNDHHLRFQMGARFRQGPGARSARALGAGGGRPALPDAPA